MPDDRGSVLPEQQAEQKAYLVECDSSAVCRLGKFSMASVTGGAQLEESEATGSLVSADSDYHNVGGVFDFEALVPVSEQTIRVVLPQRQAIPSAAHYRKYAPNLGWTDFVEDTEDTIYSSPGAPGFCPPPGDSSWKPGLAEGDWCVQLRIKDGGPNDADSRADGVVTDPGGVGTVSRVDYKTKGGGAFGPAGLLLLLAGVLLRGMRKVSRRWLARPFTVMLACAVLTAVPGSASAGGRGQSAGLLSRAYVTADLGLASTSVSKGHLERRFADDGISAEVHSVDGNRFGYGLGFGYQIFPRVAVELSYLDLGDVNVSFTAPSTARELARVHPESGHGPALSGVFNYPIVADFYVTAGGGAFFWKHKYRTRRKETGTVDNYTADGVAGFWELGAQYRLFEQFSLTAEVHEILFKNEPTFFYTTGFRWHVF